MVVAQPFPLDGRAARKSTFLERREMSDLPHGLQAPMPPIRRRISLMDLRS